jgi:hypothetical protein
MASTKITIKRLVFASLTLALVISLFLPTGVKAKSDLIRLTINNRNTNPMYLRLTGPTFYYLSVEDETRTNFTIERGEYDYSLTACGATTTGTLDLSSNKILVMPICGGNAGASSKNPDKVDLSAEHKLVRVSVENETNGRALVILTGPSTYVFSLDKDKTYTYTVIRGEYDVQYYACGRYATRTWTAQKDHKLIINCP